MTVCDCHVHVFESPQSYPFANAPAYVPPYAPVSVLEATADEAGFQRAVLVQPTPYGDDPSLLLASLRQLGDRARGVAVAGAEADVEALARLKHAGVRALRFVENRKPDGSRMPGTVPVDILLDHLAPRLAELRMHAEIWAPLPLILSRWDRLEKTGLPVVLDHMAGVDTALGVDHADFRRLLALLREGRLWVKLAVCRRARQETGFADARPFHDALVEANDARLMWASDFPFVAYPGPPPRSAELLSLFRRWVGDPATAHRILSANPTALYGFGGG